MARKKLVIIISSIVVVIAVLVGLIVSTSINQSNRDKAYTETLSSIPGIRHVFIEINHPGVPTNTSILVFAVIDMSSEDQVARSIEAMLHATYDANIASSYDLSIYAMDADTIDSTSYSTRRLYFSNNYIEDEHENAFKEGLVQVGGLDILENQIKIGSGALRARYE